MNPQALFARSEYIERWSRARTTMVAAGVDALLVTAPHNYEYLSGHTTPSSFITARPRFMVLPCTGEPIIVVARSNEAQARCSDAVTDIRTYDGFEDAALSLLVAVIREYGLGSARLGMEYGLEQRLGLRQVDLERLKAAFPGIEPVDATDIMWHLRMRKSEAEIEFLRESNRITAAAYGELLAEMSPGWTQQQVYHRFVERTLAYGARQPGYIVMSGGPGDYERINGWPGRRKYRQGDLFWMDGGCVYGGYWSDYSRCAAVGMPSQMQQETYAFVARALQQVVRAISAGMTAANVASNAHEAFESQGHSLGVASRVGHGIGLDLTEPPSLMVGDNTVLLPGMCVAIELAMITEEGWFHVEENLVVREGGFELLSEPTPATLPVIADGKESGRLISVSRSALQEELK